MVVGGVRKFLGTIQSIPAYEINEASLRSELKNKTGLLNERIKEQKCLCEIANLKIRDESISGLLKKAVNLIPYGWRVPDKTSASISYNSHIIKSDLFVESDWIQSSELITESGDILSISVYYSGEIHDHLPQPVLEEEEKLLNAICENLVLKINQMLFQENLVESEQRLSTILKSEPECVKIVDREGYLIEMNPAGLSMIEAKEDEGRAIGKKIYGLIHPEDRAVFKNLHQKALDGKAGEARFRITGLRGTTRWVESSSVPLRHADGDIYAVLSITRDISKKP